MNIRDVLERNFLNFLINRAYARLCADQTKDAMRTHYYLITLFESKYGNN